MTVPSQSSALRLSWLMWAILFFASVAAALNQFKVPPMMLHLQASFDISLATAGWLMAIFSLVGALLALPAGLIIEKIGLKNTGTLALGSLLIGASLGCISTSLETLLISRIFEGVSLCLIGVVAPAGIALWFPADKRGTPMGIWGCWVPLGAVLMFNLAPFMASTQNWVIDMHSWRQIWYASAGIAVVALVLYVLVFRLPPEYIAARRAAAFSHANAHSSKPSLFTQMKNRDIWLLALCFGCMNVGTISINTFLPVFLSLEHQVTPQYASFLTSLLMLLSMVTGIGGGIVSDRIGSRKKLLVWPLLLTGLCMAVLFSLPLAWYLPFLMCMGLFMGPIPTATFSAAPEIMGKPELAGLGLAIVAFGQNLGMFLGPIAFGLGVEQMGWATTGAFLFPVMILAVLTAFTLKVR